MFRWRTPDGRRRRSWAPLWVVVAWLATSPLHAASLEGVRVGAHADFTRIVLDTSRSLAPDIARPDPTTVVLTLPARPTVGGTPAGEGLVERVRVDGEAGAARVTLGLTAPARVAEAFALAPGDGRWHRYVVDLERDPAAAAATPAARRAEPAPAARAARAEPLRVRVPVPIEVRPRRRPAIAAPTPKRRPPPARPVVVVDAGHGGRDPGAIGANGLQEKAVTLAVARLLAERLVADGTVEVVLTRERDTSLPLAERLAVTAANEADLFLSLHADSLPAHPHVRGASVYTLSAEASDPEAARKARKENAADRRLEVIAAAPDETVRTILTSLMRDSTARRSEELARRLALDLAAVTPLLPRARRSANFVVLRSLNTPSVLVELGYLSNAADAAALAGPDHRAALADAIFRAVTAYFGRG